MRAFDEGLWSTQLGGADRGRKANLARAQWQLWCAMPEDLTCIWETDSTPTVYHAVARTDHAKDVSPDVLDHYRVLNCMANVVYAKL